MPIDSLMNLKLGQAKRLGKGHPVFMAQSITTYMKFVFKGELFGNLNINEARFTAQLMGELYEKVTTGFGSLRLLTAFELPMLPSILPFDARNDLKARQFWYIMEALSNLHDLDHLTRDMKTDPEAQKVLRLVQKKPALMQGLGRICVVDFFLGNNDRLDRDGTLAIVNPGNIFIMTPSDARDGKFSGIDFFDPNSPYKSLFKSINEQISNASSPWLGDYLRDNQGRERDAMSREIIPAYNRWATDFPIGPAHGKEFRKGMHDAIPLLKKALQERKKTGIIPVGLTSRMVRLGW